MDQAVAVAKATLALLLLVAGLWHLFDLGKWLATGGGSRFIPRRREQPKADPLKNASIDPR